MKLIIKKKNVTCYCDFCGKSDNAVAKMVDGQQAFICCECVEEALKLTRPNLTIAHT